MSSSSETGLQKSQYHHYVPQFILRKFSDFQERLINLIQEGLELGKARSKAKQRARTNCLTLEHGYEKARLEQRKVEKFFGVQDMYCGTSATEDRQHIEHMLADLETKASDILRGVEQNLSNGKSTTILGRTDKDTLRRFLFIMLYRNKTLHSRFEKSAEEYDSPDKKILLSYMRKNGYASPKDVWLANIKAFLEVRLGHDSQRWMEEFETKTDPEGAKWFAKHLNGTFLSFCTPVNRDDEFILTQNAYSIFEGPSDHTGWIDWHVFSPVSPKLMIVMRQNVLQPLAQLRELGIVSWPIVNQGGEVPVESWLKDLPVERPATSYNPILVVDKGSTPLGNHLSDTDTFTYTFFAISTVHTQKINTLFLEEAIDTQAIAYKTESGLRKALEAYLKEEKQGFKTAHSKGQTKENAVVLGFDMNGSMFANHEDRREYHRIAYLLALERICRSLGSTVEAKYNLCEPQHIEILPALSQKLYEKWCKLGGVPGNYGQLFEDLHQADAITTLKTRTDAAVHSHPLAVRNCMRHHRSELISSLNPRRVWLHLRQLRAMFRIGPDEYDSARAEIFTKGDKWKTLVTQEASNGPEDALIAAYQVFRPADFCRVMTRLFTIDSHIQQRTNAKFDLNETKDLVLIVPGTILKCGIPKVEERAREIFQRGCSQNALEKLVSTNPYLRSLEYRGNLELALRTETELEFETIFDDEINTETLKGLREVLFDQLYRTRLVLEKSR